MRLLRAFVLGVVAAIAAPAGAGPATITLDGYPYVELAQIAQSVRGSLDATPSSARAQLRAGGHTVTLTRNWSQVLLDGRLLILDAPVRVGRTGWLVPQSFGTRVVPQLVASTATPSALPVAAAGAALPARTSAPARTGIVLNDLRLRSYPTFTRVVLETTVPLEHRIETAGPREARVVLLSFPAAPRTEELHDGLVDTVQLERSGAHTVLRVLFEGTAGPIRTNALVDPFRLVIDLLRPEERGREPGAGATPIRTIVLDAGHGGHDPGAQGPTGLQEKDLVLDVTRRVAKLVQERLDVKVRLSRDGDYFVPLRDRTSFANKERADLFVSIHANAHREVASAGVETYFLSSEATDSGARQVAALENSVVQLEKTPARSSRFDAVKAILWDLAQSEFQLESSRLAEVVQDSMTQSLRIPNRGVKQAGFYVLGGAAMPAVLIEIGFVTNPKEERKLKDTKYRDEIARAIFAGLAEYKRNWDQRARAAAETPAVTRTR